MKHILLLLEILLGQSNKNLNQENAIKHSGVCILVNAFMLTEKSGSCSLL